MIKDTPTICPRCKTERKIPDGKRPLTLLCGHCLLEIEAELKMKTGYPQK